MDLTYAASVTLRTKSDQAVCGRFLGASRTGVRSGMTAEKILEFSKCVTNVRVSGDQARGSRVEKVCHARKNPTDRANAGVEPGRTAFAGVSRFAGEKSAGSTAPSQASAGTD